MLLPSLEPFFGLSPPASSSQAGHPLSEKRPESQFAFAMDKGSQLTGESDGFPFFFVSSPEFVVNLGSGRAPRLW